MSAIVKIIELLKFPALFILFAFLFLNSFYNLNGSDYLFHIKSGEQIAARGEMLRTDVFSFTKQGKEWVNHEWLYQILIHFLHSHFGIYGLFLLKSAVFCSAFFLLVLIALKVDWLASFFPIFYGLLISLSRFTLRPDNFSFLLLILFLIPFVFKNRKFLFFLPFLQILWVNIHGFFLLGPAILLIYLLSERIGLPDKEKNFYDTVKIIFFFSLLACLINPQPIKTLIYPFQVIGDIFSGKQKVFYEHIQELASPLNNLSDRRLFFKYLLFTGLCFIFPKKLRPFYVGLWLFIVLFSINSLRNLYFLIPVGIVVFVDRYLHIKNFLTGRIFRKKSFIWVRLVLLSLIIWVNVKMVRDIVFLYGSGTSYLSKDNLVYTKSVFLNHGWETSHRNMIDFIKSVDLPERMFNNFNAGSHLIFNFSPQRKVFIDGRAEFYGPEYFTFHVKLLKGDKEAFKEAVDKYKLQGFIIDYSKTVPPPLIGFLYRQGFKCIYFDKYGIIFVKKEFLKGSLRPYLVDFRSQSPKKIELINNLKLKCPDVQGLYNMAYILNMLKFYDNSKLYLEEALKVSPNHSESYYLLGEIYYQNKDYEKAFLNCRNSIFFNRNFHEVKRLLAKIYIKKGQMDDARELLDKLKIDFDEFLRKVKDE